MIQQLAVFAQLDEDAAAQGILAGLGAMLFVYLAVLALLVVSMWVIFAKAGKPGWAAIVPVYNTWVFVEICKKEPLWFVLMFIPCVNIIIILLLLIELAKAFGKGTGFGLGMFFLPFVFCPMLAFGDAKYQGQQ